MTTYTPDEAKARLQELADDAENENYHTVCGLLYEAMGVLDGLNETAVLILPLEWRGTETFKVVKD